jgi:phage/plasmid-like protein (TIGR03299 family)
MAHNLEFRNGKTSFASTTKAWHGLGTIVDKAMTSKEAIVIAQLDYEVDKTPALACVNGEIKNIPGTFATYRKDNGLVFGQVGNRYTIVQNRDAFTFFDSIVGQGQAIFETAGVLGLGERIFVTAKMPKYIRIANTDDLMETYVVLTSSHDGTGSIVAGVTSIRVVCSNTLQASLRNMVSRVNIRHTANAEQKLAQAHKLLGISNDYVTKMQEAYNILALKKVSDMQVKTLLETLYPTRLKEGEETNEASTRIKNIRADVFESYQTGVGQKAILGTAWGVFNGITHAICHSPKYKSADVKFDSIMDGAGAKVSQQAFELLVAM